MLHLSGNAGIERMKSALSDTRSKYFESKENGNLGVSPVAHISSSTPSSPDETLPSVSEQRSLVVGSSSSSRVVRSLFKDVSSPLKVGPITSETIDTPQGTSTREKLITENELLVNEIVHGGQHSFTEHLDIESEDQIGIKVRIVIDILLSCIVMKLISRTDAVHHSLYSFYVSQFFYKGCLKAN